MAENEKKTTDDVTTPELDQNVEITVSFGAGDINQVINLLLEVHVSGADCMKYATALNILQSKGLQSR